MNFELHLRHTKKALTVNSLQFDGKVRRSWNAHLIEENDQWFVLAGEFARTIKHRELGTIERGTFSLEFYHKKKWFNVFAFYEPNGSFRNFYCNINLPPTLTGDVFNYIDLDLDVLIWNDGRVEILDEDEFAENTKKFSYDSEILNGVAQTLKEILSLYEQKIFPFDCPLFLDLAE